MMRKLFVATFVAAVVYVLPKEQPLWPGMVVRCEQPGRIDSVVKMQCHWECEFGETTETYVDGGNLKVRGNGCVPKLEPISCPRSSPFGS